MKRFVLFLCAVAAWGQDGTPMNNTLGPPYVAYQTIAYNVTGATSYVCRAKSDRVSTVTVTAASNANPVSFTSTHNFGDWTNLGATVTPTVTISGGTGNWTAVNGNWTATPTASTSFTIPVNSTGFGALTGTLVVTTMSPRLNVAQWSVYKIMYDSGGYFSGIGWAQLPGGLSSTVLRGSSTGFAFACSARATLSYE